MNTQSKDVEEIKKKEAHAVFQALSGYFMNHPEAPSGLLLEAVDYVSNYLGDIAWGRTYKPDDIEDSFPTLTTHTDKRVRDIVEADIKRLQKIQVVWDWNEAASAVVEAELNLKQQMLNELTKPKDL